MQMSKDVNNDVCMNPPINSKPYSLSVHLVEPFLYLITLVFPCDTLQSNFVLFLFISFQMSRMKVQMGWEFVLPYDLEFIQK